MTIAKFGLLVLALALTACGSLGITHGVSARFADVEIQTTVDDAMAVYYLRDYLAGARRQRAWDAAIAAVHHEVAQRIPTRRELAAWSSAYSPDFAALVFARQVYAQAQREPLYRGFREELSALLAQRSTGGAPAAALEPDLLFLFVPGWLYQTQPATGADFARIRRLLARHGARVELVQSGENASVEHNAQHIAARLRELALANEQVVLVSVSKGGPEAALALSLLGEAAASRQVKAWVNIGGLLQGTALADSALVWPIRWYVQSAMVPDGSLAGIRSLAVEHSMRRWQGLRLPAHLLIVNYVGIPLSGHITEGARSGYSQLRAQGPNDGLTILSDALAPDAVTIPLLGVDHYFQHPDIDAKTLALARVIARHVKLTLR